MEWAESVAYSFLQLKPIEFMELSPMEFFKMVDGYEKRKLQSLWFSAYFTANIMGTQIKNITPEKLMKPFLPEKSKAEKEQEKEEFFASFYAKRKEVESCQR